MLKFSNWFSKHKCDASKSLFFTANGWVSKLLRRKYYFIRFLSYLSISILVVSKYNTHLPDLLSILLELLKCVFHYWFHVINSGKTFFLSLVATTLVIGKSSSNRNLLPGETWATFKRCLNDFKRYSKQRKHFNEIKIHELEKA